MNPALTQSCEFEWDTGNIDHIARHKVSLQEAEEVFFDKDNVGSPDIKHSHKEKRFIIIGKTKHKRILYQVYTIRGRKIRVLSSRDINKKEVYLYEKKANRT